MNVEDHRRLLGVTPTTDADGLKAAYRRLAKIWHPDVCGDDGAKFKQLSVSYEFLTNFKPTKSTPRGKADDTRPYKLFRHVDLSARQMTIDLPFEGDFVDHDTDVMVLFDGRLDIIKLHKGIILPTIITVWIFGRRVNVSLRKNRSW